MKKEGITIGKFRNLIDKRFGRLTVIRRIEDKIKPSGKPVVMWLCRCDCEKEDIVVSSDCLLRKHTKSCGCYKRDYTIKRNKILNKKINKYDLSGEYGIGYTSKGEEFYFDLEDYVKIKDYCWHIDKRGYVATKIEGKDIFFHRLILNVLDEPWITIAVDNIGGDATRNNNRRFNLRICTHQKNTMNKKKYYNNTSGVTGVAWNKRNNKWLAYIDCNHKRISLGNYDVFDDAVKVRKEAEEKYFGEYSYDNSQKIFLEQ